jgi:general secretion pathway protein A
MYDEYYGLKEKPFSLTPDPQFLFLSDSHRAAIDSLHYGIEQREGFIVITGDIGTGKTTTCRVFLEKLDNHVKTAVIFNSFLTEEELLGSILLDFGFPPQGKTKKEKIDALNRLLISFLSEGKNAVLIIDEAQNLSIPVLEQIRMLSNLETEKEKLLQIILFGQLELDQKLRSSELKQLNQRIAVRYRLLPLTRTEMEFYIYQRLMVAGSQGSISFSKSALNRIYKFSKGIPRLINLLCDRALLGGFVEQTFHIDKGIIKKAKDSLLGEEESPKPFYCFFFPKGLPLLRIVLLSILALLLAGMILTNQDYRALLQNAINFIEGKIQGVYSEISGATSPSASILPSDKERVQDSPKAEFSKDSEGVSQEVSK